MDEKRKQNTSGGFLLGVIFGVILTLLFTTKKGRQVLRMLADEGLNKFADLEDLLQEKIQPETDAEEDDNDYLSPDERVESAEGLTDEMAEEVPDKPKRVEQEARKVTETEAFPTATPAKSSAKRFFHKTSKK